MPRALCPKCDARLMIPDDLAHRRIQCGTCGHKFSVIAPAEHILPRSNADSNQAAKPDQPIPSLLGQIKTAIPETLPTKVVAAGLGAMALMFFVGSVLLWPTESRQFPAAPADTAPSTPPPQVLQSAPDFSPPVTPTLEERSLHDLKLASGTATNANAGKEENENKDPIETALKSVVLVKTGDGFGSGFIYGDPTSVVTNFHVIAGATAASVVFPQGTIAKVVGFRLASPQYDFAILELDQPESSAPPLKRCENKPRRGDDVFSLGSPKGLAGSASKGSVSAYRNWQEIARSLGGDQSSGDPSFAADSQWIQTSAPISNGNSGGPLVTESGEVLAVNTWMLVSGQNLNFSLDIGHIADVFEHGLHQARPLASLPRPIAVEKQPVPRKVTPQEIAAIKIYWTSLAKSISNYRGEYAKWSTGDSYRVETIVRSSLRWPQPADTTILRVLNKAAAEIEAIPTRNVPDSLADFSQAISEKMRLASGCYERICALRPIITQPELYGSQTLQGMSGNGVRKPGFMRFTPHEQAQREQEQLSASRLLSEANGLIHSEAPRIKRILEKVVNEDLPQLDHSR